MSENIEKIQKEIAATKMALSAGVEVDVVDKYTTEQVETLLKRLPRTKYEAAKDVVDKLVLFKDAKRNVKKVIAQQMMLAKKDDSLTAAPDRKAKAEASPAVEEAEIMLIDAEARLRIAEFLHEAHDDLFTAVKKIASIKISQEEDAKNANKFDNSQRNY